MVPVRSLILSVQALENKTETSSEAYTNIKQIHALQLNNIFQLWYNKIVITGQVDTAVTCLT
jgi:hypothetical protein